MFRTITEDRDETIGSFKRGGLGRMKEVKKCVNDGQGDVNDALVLE
jgi:hypothetical protein